MLCLVFLEAVGARYKIDPMRFDDFFRTSLRRTLAQMLCDIRRRVTRLIKSGGGGGEPHVSSGVDVGDVGNLMGSNASAAGVNEAAAMEKENMLV